jgi:hypothetical protein
VLGITQVAALATGVSVYAKLFSFILETARHARHWRFRVRFRLIYAVYAGGDPARHGGFVARHYFGRGPVFGVAGRVGAVAVWSPATPLGVGIGIAAFFSAVAGVAGRFRVRGGVVSRLPPILYLLGPGESGE